MARYKNQRLFGGLLLYILTAVWLAAWLVGWLVLDEPDLAEPGFYVFWVFAAASLVYAGLRGAIEE